MALNDFLKKAKQAMAAAEKKVQEYGGNLEAKINDAAATITGSKQEEEARLAEQKRQEEERLEKERLEQEKKQAERERKAQEKKEQEEKMKNEPLPELPVATCPHGYCHTWLNEHTKERYLYCTCANTQECPKGRKERCKDTYYYDEEKYRHSVRYQNLNKHQKEKAITAYIDAFYPNLADPELKKIREMIGKEIEYYGDGLGYVCSDTSMVLQAFNERGGISKVEEKNIDIMLNGSWSIEGGRPANASKYFISRRFWQLFENDPDFFKWDHKDFEFALKVMTRLDEPELCSFFMEVRPDHFDQLFDSNGHVKPSGLKEKDSNNTDTLYGQFYDLVREYGIMTEAEAKKYII